MLVGARRVQPGKIQKVGDRLQRIIDFVCDGRRQPARGGEFLVTTQGFFRAQLLTDIPYDRRSSHHRALPVAQGGDDILSPKETHEDRKSTRLNSSHLVISY